MRGFNSPSMIQKRHCCSKRKWKLLLYSLLSVCIVGYVVWLMQDDSIILGEEGELISVDDYYEFEPELADDFPVNEDPSASTEIPRILHQTWKDRRVPPQFQNNIRSFITHNPSFSYYFWTDGSARMLINERHPHLLETFDNYAEPVRRADMIRYVVLYEYGGVYADLDTECLRPLERVLSKYACVVSPEAFEHASLLYNTDLIVTNSIMFCKPQHLFLRTLMNNLPDFSHFSQDIDASGPNYVTYHFNKYQQHVIDKRNRDVIDNEYVYLTSSQYFQNSIDPIREGQFRKLCRRFSSLNNVQRRGCVALKRRGFKRRDTEFTMTKHAFYHTGYKLVKTGDMDISEIVPHVKIYNGSLTAGL